MMGGGKDRTKGESQSFLPLAELGTHTREADYTKWGTRRHE